MRSWQHKEHLRNPQPDHQILVLPLPRLHTPLTKPGLINHTGRHLEPRQVQLHRFSVGPDPSNNRIWSVTLRERLLGAPLLSPVRHGLRPGKSLPEAVYDQNRAPPTTCAAPRPKSYPKSFSGCSQDGMMCREGGCFANPSGLGHREALDDRKVTHQFKGTLLHTARTRIRTCSTPLL